ncbi:TPA: VENN motif pre-toxin domain-containing protein [Yersinia enterocolitica]
MFINTELDTSTLGGMALLGLGNDRHADGTITVRDTEKQQQNVTALSRDVEHANNALSPIFDKEKEQNRLREINLIGEIGNQVADIARTQGKIAEEKALKDPKAIQAATAITQGLTGGNIGQALAGGSAPYLAHEISKYLPADQSLGANLMAHAVLGAVVGHFSGNATVCAISAFTAEAAAPAIIKAMGWDKDSLTEKQKQTVSVLATLAAGLAGGLVGDSSSSAVAGAQAGKNAVENNSLSGDHGRESMKQAAESLKNQIRDKLGEGTTSSIANAIITALADTGDTALGGVDYALDYVMALASCATGDSYCTQALNDLAGKNQAAADTVKALIQSETWSAIAESAKKAYDGDQMALEATGGMLAGLFLPGKKMPHVPNAGAVGNMAEFFKKLVLVVKLKRYLKKLVSYIRGKVCIKPKVMLVYTFLKAINIILMDYTKTI